MHVLVPRQIYPMHAMNRAAVGHTMVVSAMVGFRLEEPGVYLEDKDMWSLFPDHGDTKNPFDLWMPKQGAEFLVWGSAQAAEPVTHMDVSVRCGPLHKRLSVWGDRHWVPGLTGWKASEPLPFTDMPIVWPRSFGGPGVAAHPEGVGANAMALIDAGQRSPLPNVTLSHHGVLHPEDAGVAAGFEPLPIVATVPTKAGTFDRAWMAQRFPAMPEDFDPASYNRAPRDQRIAGVWQGGESVVIEGMNASRPRLECAIPLLRMRCFFTHQDVDGLIEQPTRMDTVALFPNVGCGVLVFRADIAHAGHLGKSLNQVMLGLEDIGAPRALEHYQQIHAWRTDPATASDHLLEDQELMPVDMQALQAFELAQAQERQQQQTAAEARASERLRGATAALGSAAMASVLNVPAASAPTSNPVPLSTPQSPENAAMEIPKDIAAGPRERPGGMQRLAERLTAEPQTPLASILKDWVIDQGVDQALLADSGPWAGMLSSSLTDSPEIRQRMADSLQAFSTDVEDRMQNASTGFVSPEIRSMLESPSLTKSAQAIGRPELVLELQRLAALFKDGSDTFDAPEARSSLKAIFSNLGDMGEKLSESADTDALTPNNLKGLLSHLANGSKDEGNPLVQAMEGLRDGSPVPASMRERVQAISEDMGGITLESLLEEAPPDFFEQMKVKRQLSLDELMRMLDADGVSESAKVQGLAQADEALESIMNEGGASSGVSQVERAPDAMAETQAVAPDIAQARRDSRGDAFRPVDVSTTAASALGAAVLREHAEGRSFKDRDLAGADLSGADLSGVDFSGALLECANLSGADLSGAQCAGAVFIGARLDKANCTGADFTRAHLEQVQAESSQWASANLSGAVLTKVNLSGAQMQKARLDGCHATEACLQGADLSGSLCERGDFSGADLTGAQLNAVTWTQTFLVGALLHGCQAAQAHLAGCMLIDAKGEGFNLAQSHLEKTSLIGANLPHLHAPGLRAPESSWYGTQLVGAMLDGSHLAAAHFSGANLVGGSLNRCNLKEALFNGAHLQGASLEGAQLYGAMLLGADATGADFHQAVLFGADLDGAVLDRCDLGGASLVRTLLALPADA